MSRSLVERSLSVLELLAGEGTGASLTSVARQLELPKSATHRILADLIRLGFVRQDVDTERYFLTTRLLSVGFRHLAASGITSLAQPVLDGLARFSSELVRLALVDGDHLTWVAKAQGARSGLRYDPEMGQDVALFCTASGHAWLASFDDETAVRIVTQQGFGRLDEYGPAAPRTVSAFLSYIRAARERGFAIVVESGDVGMSAMAAAIRDPQRGVVATVSIAGPSVRLTEQKMGELGPRLLEAAAELSHMHLGTGMAIEPVKMAGGSSASGR